MTWTARGPVRSPPPPHATLGCRSSATSAVSVSPPRSGTASGSSARCAYGSAAAEGEAFGVAPNRGSIGGVTRGSWHDRPDYVPPTWTGGRLNRWVAASPVRVLVL